jgi:hypothetical protein
MQTGPKKKKKKKKKKHHAMKACAGVEIYFHDL